MHIDHSSTYYGGKGHCSPPKEAKGVGNVGDSFSPSPPPHSPLATKLNN